MKKRQLYMNIYDILPTEPLWDVIDDKQDPPETWTKEDLLKSLREDGFKFSLNVDPDGNIRNGNARYWCARRLLEEELDERFRFLPVQQNYAAGEYHAPFRIVFEKKVTLPKKGESLEERDNRLRTIGDKELQRVTKMMFADFMLLKQPFIDSETEFKEYPIDKENPTFLMRHWDQTVGTYSSFVFKHPEGPEMVFCIFLEGKTAVKDLPKDSPQAKVAEESKKRSKSLESKRFLTRTRGRKSDVSSVPAR